MNAKRKCRNCKQYYPRESMLNLPGGWFCRLQCATDYATRRSAATRAKKERKAHREAKERVKSLSELHKAAQRAFNAYIVERDRDKPCICCGANEAVQWAAGHYRTVAAAGHLRYNEDNVHKQRNRPCNSDYSGNLVGYRVGLVKRIGEARVKALENDNRTKRWTRDELRDIAAYYRDKLKYLRKAREIERDR